MSTPPPLLRQARIRARFDQIARRMEAEHRALGAISKPDPWVRSAVSLLVQILATVEEQIGIAGWHLENDESIDQVQDLGRPGGAK